MKLDNYTSGRIAAVALVAALLSLFSTALPAAAADVSLYGAGAEATVFPADVETVSATLTLSSTEKVKTEFVWIRPSGDEQSRQVKLGFPTGDGTVRVTDVISPDGDEGWWAVEVRTGGGVHLKEFLVTSDRPILSFAASGKDGRLGVLGGRGVGMELLRIAMDDPDDDVRIAAVGVAAGLGPDISGRVFELALGDGSAKVRREAVKYLAETGGDFSGYRERLLADPVDYVRVAYVEYLDAVWPPEAVDALGVLITDPSDSVRRAVIEALSDRRGEGADAVLEKGFEVRDAEFRSKLLEALVERAPGNLKAILVGRLSDPSSDIRVEAFRELEAGGGWDLSGAEQLLVDENEELAGDVLRLFIEAGDTETMIYALGSPYPGVRRRALFALRGAGGKAYIDALTESVDDDDSYIRLDAVKRLAGYGLQGVPGLRAALGGTDDAARKAAAAGLREIADPSYRQVMLGLTDDPDPDIRLAGLGYLGALDDGELADVAAKLATDPDAGVRKSVLETAGKHDSPLYSSVLSTLYHNGNPATRLGAIRFLSQRDDGYALASLVDALNDPDDRVRLVAVRYVRERDPARLPIELAADPDQDIRGEALKGMVDRPAADMVGPLEDILSDPNAANRMLALEILSGIDGPDAGGLVSRLVDDRSPEVRRRARQLVLSRGDSGVLPGLAVLVESSDPGLRDKALAAVESHGCADKAGVLAGMARSGHREVRMAALQGLVSCGSAELDAAAALLLDDPLYAVRMEAVKALAGSGSSASEAGLVKALGDVEGGIRLLALRSLVSGGASRYRGRLPELVLDSDPDVAGLALEESMRLEDRDLKVRSLIAAANGPDRRNAERAVDALAPLGDARALDVFLRYFRDGYNKPGLVEAVARVDGGSSVGALREIYRNSSSDETLRIKAVRSLSGRGEAIAETVKEALDDPSESVRLAAVDSAATITDGGMKGGLLALAIHDDGLRDMAAGYAFEDGRPGVLGPVSDAAAGLESEPARKLYLQRLIASGGKAAPVIAFASDPSVEIRRTVLDALSRRTGLDAVLGIIAAGSSPDAALRRLAGGYLSDRSPQDVKAATEMMLGGGRPDRLSLKLVAESAKDPGLLVWLVTRTGGDCDGLTAVVEPMLESSGSYSADALAEAMGRCGRQLDMRIIESLVSLEGAPATDALVRLLGRHPEYGVEILDAAGQAGADGILVSGALSSVDARVRSHAFDMLRDGAVPGAGAYIEKGLRDDDALVRSSAASAAARLGMTGALVSAAGDSRPGVRAAAVSGLSGAGVPEAYAELGRLVCDEDTGVSGAAHGALLSAGDGVQAEVWLDIVTARCAPAPALLAAVSRLARQPDPKYAGVLAGMLGSGNDEVSREAAKGLIDIGPASLPSVHPLLKDESAHRYALDVVAAIADQSSVGALSGLLEGHAEMTDGQAVIAALGKIGGGESAGVIAGSYEGAGPGMKVAVLKALSASGASGDDTGLVELVRGALRDRDDNVRFYGANAAGELGMTALRDEIAVLMGTEENRVVRTKLESVLDSMGGAPAR